MIAFEEEREKLKQKQKSDHKKYFLGEFGVCAHKDLL